MDLETGIGIAFGVVLLCAAAAFVIPLIVLINRRNAKLKRETQGWPATPGRVVRSEVVDARTYFIGKTPEEVEREWASQDAQVPLGVRLLMGLAEGSVAADIIPDQVERSHWPLVLYEYEVGGVRYTSFTVKADERQGPSRGGIVYSRNLVSRYPVGAAVTVYYNPRHPPDATLER